MTRKHEYTTVMASRGAKVHAVSFHAHSRTLCGRAFSGWIVSPKILDCDQCQLAIIKAREALR